MSRGESKTKSLFAGSKIAGNGKAVFSLREGLTGAAIQVVIVEDCLCVSSFVDEDISLDANSYTDVDHGFETGLKGVLAAVTGTTSVFDCEDISVACDQITEAAHDLVTGERGQLTVQIGCPSTTPFCAFAVCCCTLTITEACHCYIKGEVGQFTTTCADLPAGLSLATDYFVTNVAACTYDLSSTRALAIACCSDLAVTDQGSGCHTFTPSGTLPTELCLATNYFIIDNGACTYQLATTRALALAACPVGIVITNLNSPASITFTANGAIPTGSTACSFIIKIDDDTYKLATSKVLAEAGTVDPICALNAPASLTFTAAAADCTSGTVTVRYSVDDVTYTIDAGAGLLDTPGTILAAGLTVVDNADGLHYNSIEVDVDIIDSQWVVDIDVSGKV